MSTEIKVPTLGESISEAVVMEWLVKVGDFVKADQDLVVLETDKVTVNVPSPTAGKLVEQRVGPDDRVEIDAIIGVIDESAQAEAKAPAQPAPAPAQVSQAAPAGQEAQQSQAQAAPSAPAVAVAAEAGGEPPMMPAARRLVSEHGLDASSIPATGRGGRLLKEDVLGFLKQRDLRRPTPSPAPAPEAQDREEVVPMSPLRRKIAERLVQAQQTAAMLTTFNEIDMTAVLALRKQYQDAFTKKHGIKLGFLSFFAKACVEGLKAFPAVNAEVRGDSIVYKNYYDIGVAVGGGRGLVVPVVRDADQLGFADFEKRLAELADRARTNKLTLEELQGGTFTISNGGIYGSLLSTPILNPPQSGILGLHKIEERPIALNGQVVIRPMMYVALSYDHRIVDGREAVSFLVKIKEALEDPSRILLEV